MLDVLRCSDHGRKQPCEECRRLRKQRIAPERPDPIVAAIAAIGRNRELGYKGKLLWRIPEDLRRFKSLTKGHPLILGRKTFESILGYQGEPLPGRTNIVISRDPSWKYEGTIVAHSLEEAMQKARELHAEEINIGGGAEIYREALPLTDRLYLTLVDAEGEADTFFPPYEDFFTKKVFEEEHERHGIKYRYVNLERP